MSPQIVRPSTVEAASTQDAAGGSPPERKTAPSPIDAGGRTTGFVVLGMHRSGTSAVTRLLSLLGAALPQNLMPPHETNEAGFWESKDLADVHDEIFSEMGSSWRDPKPLPSSWFATAAALRYRDRIVQVLWRDFSGVPSFVVKDPRMCRLVPLWLSVLSEVKAEAAFVISIRHPLEVAASLTRRDGFSTAHGVLLWLRYMLEAERTTRGHRRTFVQYESVLGDWRRTAMRMFGDLGVEWHEPSAATSEEIDAFLERGLRHHSHRASDLQVRTDVAEWVRVAYAAFSDAEDHPARIRRLIEPAARGLAESDVAWGPIIAEAEERHREELERQSSVLRAEISARDREIARLTSEVLRFSEALREQQLEEGRLRAEITRLGEQSRQDLAAADRRLHEEVAAVDGRLREELASVERLRGEVVTAETTTRAIRDELERLEAELEGLRVEREGEARALGERLAEREAEVRRVSERADALEREIGVLRDDLAEARRSPAEVIAHRARSVARRALMGASAPVRRIALSAWWLATGRFSEERRTRRIAAAIAPLFDSRYYFERHPDVARSGLPPDHHFVRFGAAEGRNPNALFDVSHYLSQAPNLSHSEGNPLLHYLERGAAEGLDPIRPFDSSFYLETYDDVRAAGVNPLRHFIERGPLEARDPHPLFDTSYYLESHPEVAAAGMNPLVHYLERGRAAGFPTNREGRALHASERPPDSEIERARANVEHLALRPRISIVMPVYNGEPRFLARAIDSVRNQIYEDWELCICDDGSTDPRTIEALRTLAAGLRTPSGGDLRIRVMFSPENRGIAAASNAALATATGDWVSFLDHDDELTIDALWRVVQKLNEDPSIDVLYSDEDKIDADGWLDEPFHKPDWSPALFRGVMYVGHLLVARKALVDAVGGFDSRFDKVQDYELVLRLSERTSRIAHLPKILYHWRKIPGSLALGESEKTDIVAVQPAAVAAHLERIGVRATARPHPVFPHRVQLLPGPLERSPKVSIVIPSKDAPEHLGRCLDSIFEKTTYPDFEVVVVDNGTTDPEALAILRKHPVRVVPFAEAFNFSRANNVGAAAASGEILVLLNNDTEVQTQDWLENLLFHLELPDVGAVGPLLVYPDGRVQHAGVVLGFRGTADHVMRFFPKDADGYAGSLSCSREVSVVTAACLMVRKAEYLERGGLCEDFRTIYQDVDFCLRLREAGRRILYTPGAVLTHHESASRGTAYDHLDRALLLDLWGETIRRGDPFYNPSFDLDRTDYSLRPVR